MTKRKADQNEYRLEQSIQDALNHALAYGDDRTAFDLAMILRGMTRPYGIAA